MANQLNKFDQMIRETFEGYEAPYDHAHWEELEEELNVAAPGLSSYFGAITTGLVLTSVVFIGMLFINSIYFDKVSADQNITEEQFNGDKNAANSMNVANNPIEKSSEHSNYSIENKELTPNSGHTEELENKLDSKQSEFSKTAESSQLAEKVGQKEIAASDIDDSDQEKLPSKETVIEISEVDDSPKVRTGCTGMTIDFNASEEYGKDAHFLWNFGDGYFSNEANPSHTFSKEGVFDVSLSITSPSSGQITSNVIQAMIEVVEAPIANLELEIESTEFVSVGNKSYNATESQWKLDGEVVSAKTEINISIADNTQHQLALIAYNEGGCTDTLQAIVNAVRAGNEFPRAYAPSYGTTFAPGAIVDDGTVTSIKIFEKNTGSLVFEGSGNKGWEGKNLKGEKANPGKYSWVMLVKKIDIIDIYQGEIQLR